MLTWNLFNAELLKARKMPINIVLMIAMSTLGILFLGGFTLLALAYGNNYIGDPEYIYSYPNSLYLTTVAISTFSAMICIIYSANSVGTEYGRDTWKMLLPRYGSRVAFLSSKLAVALLAMIIYIILTFAVWLLFSYLCTKVLRVNATSVYVGVGEFNLTYSVKMITMTMVRMIFYGLVTMLVTIAFRSLIGGVVAGMGLSFTLSNVNEIPVKALVRAIPTTHIANIEAYWIKDDKALERIQASFGYAISPNVSIMVVSVSILIIIGLMFYLFHRRDMAGLG